MKRDWLRFYTSFKGRATRYEFNIPYALVMFLGMIAAACMDFILAGGDVETAAVHSPFSNAWNLIIIWPTLAVSARRLHDMNFSGWWQVGAYGFLIGGVVWMMVQALGGEMFMSERAAYQSAGFVFVIVGVFLVFFVGLSCIRGTKGANKYGPDPLENAA